MFGAARPRPQCFTSKPSACPRLACCRKGYVEVFIETSELDCRGAMRGHCRRHTKHVLNPAAAPHEGGLDCRVRPVAFDGHRGCIRQVRASQPRPIRKSRWHSDPRYTTARDP